MAQPARDEAFLRFALSVAELQRRGAEIALQKQARPQVHALAGEVLKLRASHRAALEPLAARAGLEMPAALQFEHAVILENLQPLDFLAFSRRWADVQVQALQQEIAAYERYAAEPQAAADIAAFVKGVLPQLQARLRHALEVREATRD